MMKHLLIWWLRFLQLIWWWRFLLIFIRYLWHIKFSKLHIRLLFILFLRWRRVILWWHHPFSFFRRLISFQLSLICWRHQFFRWQVRFWHQKFSVRWFHNQWWLKFRLLSLKWKHLLRIILIQRSFRWLKLIFLQRRLKLIKRGQGLGFHLQFWLIQLRRQRHQLLGWCWISVLR